MLRMGWVAGFRATVPALGRIPFKLADIGEGIAEVEVLQWFVQPGDHVKQFDKLCEVQSDKATVEITSRFDGRVETLGWEVGDMAKVGSTLVELEVEGKEAAAEVDTDEEHVPNEEGNEDTESIAPSEDENARNNLELKEPHRALARAGSFSVDPVIRPPSDAVAGSTGSTRQPFDTGKILASPAVRRLARDHGLELSMVPATGPGGRVLKGDVLHYVANVPKEERRRQADALRAQELGHSAAQVPPSASLGSVDAGAGDPSTQGVSTGGVAPLARAQRLTQDVLVPVKGIQRIMVQAMDASLRIPHFNFMEEYEMTKAAEFRAQLQATAEQRGLKMSYMPILIKAASLSLVRFPGLNAHVNADASEVVHKASHNIGVAMDTPRGLLVPVIKDVQEKSIMDVAADLLALQDLGAQNKLGEAELTGGTFTLSNIGAIGGTYASPIIPSPTVVIGALGKIKTLPRFEDEHDVEAGVVATKIMAMSWAADHRVVDGATMARFSNQLKEYLENPLSMVGDLN